MNCIGAGGRAHVDVRAAGRSLLRIVHGRIHAQFLNGFGSRRRQRLADRQINRRRALDRGCRSAVGIRHTGVVYDAGRGHLAGALAIEQIAGIDAVEQETVAGIALAIGPDGLIAQDRCWRRFRRAVRRLLREKE